MSDTDPTETGSDDRPERRSRFGEIASELGRSGSGAEGDSSDESSTPVDEAEEPPNDGVDPSTESEETTEQDREAETGSDATRNDEPDDIDSWEWFDGGSDGTDETRTDRTGEDGRTNTDAGGSSTGVSEPPAEESETDRAGDAESVDESATGIDRTGGPERDDGGDDSEHDPESRDDFPSGTIETTGSVETDGESAGRTHTRFGDDGSIVSNERTEDGARGSNTSRTTASARKQRLWSSDSSTKVDDRTVDRSDEVSSEPEATTSANPFADASNGSDEYRRPDGLDPSPGTSVLIECGTRDGKKEAACHDMLGLQREGPARNVILVRYRKMDPARLGWIAEQAERTELITVGYSQSIPPSVDGAIGTTNINNPNDITRLGILVSRKIKDVTSEERTTVFGYDSLNMLLEYKNVQSTFRFLHVFLGTLTETGTIAHFHVDPLAGDPQKINTLKPLFDEIVSVDSVGVHLE